MRNLVKNSLYASAGVALVGLNSANAAINFGKEKVDAKVQGTGATADVAIQNLLDWLMGFLALAAFLYLVWGGFQFLTAAGDEEKVKKGKTIIIQSLLGIFVIWISWAVVSWLIAGLTASQA
ncbi:MAG: pilin [Candidatus Gracilibacteria bacterium]|nr:pilin [Candidatus Gracilibacteria bacterium]